MGRLQFDDALATMKDYGKMLLNNVPEQTTALLKRLCTDYKPIDEPLVKDERGTEITSIMKATPDEFIHIFVDDAGRLIDFLQHMVRK